MRAVVESGECFVRLLPADITPANPIGLRLQVLESNHLDAARPGLTEGIPTLQGIGLRDGCARRRAMPYGSCAAEMQRAPEMRRVRAPRWLAGAARVA